jgi:serine/threonine-protein kinase PknK
VRERSVQRSHRFDYGAIVGSSRAMQDVFALLDRVIDTTLPVLVQGDSGTGKELVARAIHANGPQKNGPLVSINCGALPEQLLESELFGYERGAFTGADQARAGLVAEARGGVLFLDELGEMSLPMQVKLLRVLQEREVRPIGSRRTIPVDFRLVCATNRRLREEVALGRFREDLFYRVSAVEITIPSLRERAEDIPELVLHIAGRVAASLNRPAPELSRQAMRKLIAYAWPGNVRQLENTLTKAMVLSDGNEIAADAIELPRAERGAELLPGRGSFQAREKARILDALEAHRWNVKKVSSVLSIPRPTLYRKLKRYGLARQGSDDAAPEGG